MQYEWFRKDGNQCRYYNQWRDFNRLRLYARVVQSVEKYKNELYDIVVKHIKENYPIWIPGKVSGIPVRTYNNVRIHIMKE